MATLSHSESRRLYSWWWDSHISPKNSKWLQENLTDMDSKVKAMIKLIEEDADSFARRAEMYYKKRPELMKLVEEFYRAYRALAERYDHATVELRQVHRTMVEAFPSQVPYELGNSSTSGSLPNGEPHTPELPHPIQSLLDPDDMHSGAMELVSADLNSGGHLEESDSGISNKGLKQLGDLFGSGGEVSQASKFTERKTKRGQRVDAAAKGEAENHASNEFYVLKKILAEIESEKEAVVLHYQQSLQKLSSLERELKDAGGLDEQASRAEIEIKVLKETLAKLEAERDASLLQYNNCLDKISSLESLISKKQEETKGLNERATKAEVEAQDLKEELSGLEAEKEAGLLKYNQCLEMISILQNKISTAEENARLLNEQTEKAEAEAEALKQALSKLNEEKDYMELQYEQCLRRIAELESEISHAHEDVKRLNIEVLTGAAKLKSVEEQCDQLEKSNQSLQLAAGDLMWKIAIKDQEISQKENELEKLQTLLQDEQSRFFQVEATLQTLQKFSSQSQEEQKALALELQNKLQMLKDLEMSNHDLQGDLQQAKEENQSLIELNNSSSIVIENLQNKISSLKELKGKLEEDLALQVAQSNSLQQEIQHLKEEIDSLNRRYQALLEQLCSVGLNPEFLVASVRNIQDENLKLKEVCKKDSDEKDALCKKLKEMKKILDKNVALESSLSELNGKLEGSGEKIKELQQSCQLLHGEKSGLVAEKAILLSQLQMMTENVQKLFEKNALAENSLSCANIELEGLRAKSKSLEEFFQMLKDEKSSLINERNNLLAQLQNVELRLGNLEMRFSRLEEKCNDLEKGKNSTLFQVKELQAFLGIEKQERASFIQSSEFRMADLEEQVHLLQEERRLSKKEFEEELDKAVNSQVEIFVLQRFVEDLEEKNLSLLFECQKHVEASKLSNKLMAEFETENLEQQVEIEFLVDEIEKLRMGVHQVFNALQADPALIHGDKFEVEQIPFDHMLDGVKSLQCTLLKIEDERQQLVVENFVLFTLLNQLRIEGDKLNSVKKTLEQEFQIMTQQLNLLQRDKHELVEINRQLRLEVSMGEKQEEVLKAQLESQHVNLVSLQNSYQALQEENLKVVGQNSSLLQKLSYQKEEYQKLEDYDNIVQEAVTLSNLLLVFQHFRSEKAEEFKSSYEDLNRLHFSNSDLKKQIVILGEKLEIEGAEGQRLNAVIEKLHQKLYEVQDLNDQLNCENLIGKDFLGEHASELLQAKQKLEDAENLNEELCCTIEELKRECEASKTTKKNMEMQILELSEKFMIQQKKIEGLRKINDDMEQEVGILHLEVEEHRMKEENLILELQERSNEFELWEAEASSFYFDLQACSTRELLLDNKVQELSSICEHLEEMNASKDGEIEQMKERFGYLESEVGGLKAQLSAYGPAIASLQHNIESLEHNVLQSKPSMVGSQGKLGGDMILQPPEPNYQGLVEDRCSARMDGISDLLEMQARIEAVEKVMIEQANRFAAEQAAVGEADALTMKETARRNVKLEVPLEEAELWELKGRSYGEIGFQKHRQKLRQKEPEISEFKNAILMKDIPLDQISDRSSHRRSIRDSIGSESTDDQMLEPWESVSPDFTLDSMTPRTRKKAATVLKSRSRRHISRDATQKKQDPSMELQVEKDVGIDKLEVPRYSAEEPSQEGNRRKILERLESDAKKLMSVQITVEDLRRKMELKKKGKKANNVESDRVKMQLQEVDEAILQLFSTTNQLARDIQETPSSPDENASADLEEAGNINRKRVTEQACEGSEKIGQLQIEVESIRYNLLKLEDEKKGILLRDFIYSGRRSSRRRKGACFCGCGRSSTHED